MFQDTNKCRCFSKLGPETQSEAMPLGERALMLIELLRDVRGYKICLSCGFEYVRKYVSEQLGFFMFIKSFPIDAVFDWNV